MSFLLSATLHAAGLQGQSLPAAPQPSASASTAISDERAWKQLTQLTPDLKIAVQVRGRMIRCEDPHVTSTTLYCEIRPIVQSPFFYRDAKPMEFRRSDVESVHPRHPGRIRWIGYGAATVAGFAFGASRYDPTSDATPRVLKGIGGAALFDLLTMPVVEAIAQFSYGKAVYRKP